MALTPLSHLILTHNIPALRDYLAEHREAVHTPDSAGRTPLWLAVEQDPATLEAVLSCGANVHTIDQDGETPLFSSAKDNLPAQARLLLDFGAQVNWRNAYQETALHLAATYGSPQVVEVLLSFGAELDAVDRRGRTPLLNAVYGNRPVWRLSEYTQTAERLLQAGANPHYRTPEGKSIRDYAALHVDNEPILRLLQHYSANSMPPNTALQPTG